ncbi:hypothetical protein SEA_TWONLO_81 [Gordonia phage Twonlo]|uniref:Uncharacterized protein n=1 Tax=Gordonia phage Kwekel TaxID=3077820 RepID=A0AA96QY32_9CAUD|nr:hypothetical protein SEA_ROADKILL_81 [Gordonia Terrae phage RoadKill]QOI66827.1 hypothetical protein SEA_TWONLO_81 [Gordonia phage Twonlo]QWY80278.1 hypothetical protein SEA_EDMUNDFERRY_82 [Gordonia phage EdmundFerry]WNO27386.1 hypothetical protein SEA_KWEKEL_84 [Gordonia phage Kwekel]
MSRDRLPERRGAGWYRLLNPVGTRKPPVPGSQPEAVLSVPPLPMMLVNDDWADSAKMRRIAIGTTDGTARVTIHLGGETRTDPDWFVFLGHPNRLWVRTIDGYPPALGEWLPEPPTREIAETEHRVGQTIKKARRK